jgi:hypothetical protein
VNISDHFISVVLREREISFRKITTGSPNNSKSFND